MLERLKKSKTLRSLLGAAALFGAGTPVVAEAAQKPATKITQTAQTEQDLLAQAYMPLCEQLEGNLPYCYSGKTGKVTVGCGVHVKDFSSVQNLTALKVIPKRGCSFSLIKRDRLKKMANANWHLPETKTLFPEVEKVVYIKVKNCQGKCPKSTAKKWNKELFLMPDATLKAINNAAVRFHVKNAYDCHPDLSQLPLSLRLVVVDLVYNLGKAKYQKTYPKFQKAICERNFWEAKAQCKTNNERRDRAREILINSALLCEARCLRTTPQKVCEELKKLMDKKEGASLQSKQEPAFWRVVDTCTQKNHSWYKCRQQTPVLQTIDKRSRK